jgi:uncharacterized glyoxalase superfamily protein PhnB
MPDLVLGSTVIYVESGVREVLEFYRAAFGLSIRYYDDRLKFGELETGGPTIMIASHAAAEYLIGEPFRRSLGDRPNGFEIAFIAADVATAFAKAVAAGTSPVREPTVMPWGQTVAYVSSVEGTLVGLVTRPVIEPAP